MGSMDGSRSGQQNRQQWKRVVLLNDPNNSMEILVQREASGLISQFNAQR